MSSKSSSYNLGLSFKTAHVIDIKHSQKSIKWVFHEIQENMKSLYESLDK